MQLVYWLISEMITILSLMFNLFKACIAFHVYFNTLEVGMKKYA